MLCSFSSLKGCEVAAIDGVIGRCSDLLVDETSWYLSHLVISKSRWLLDQGHLLSLGPLVNLDQRCGKLQVQITREQGASGSAKAAELNPAAGGWLKHLGWPYRWFEDKLQELTAKHPAPRASSPPSPQLRSVRELVGCHILALGGTAGQVADVIIDDQGFALRYLVIETHGWPLSRKVLLAPHWATELDWEDRVLAIGLTIPELEASPRYWPRAPISRQYEAQLHDYYCLPKYWEVEEQILG